MTHPRLAESRASTPTSAWITRLPQQEPKTRTIMSLRVITGATHVSHCCVRG